MKRSTYRKILTISFSLMACASVVIMLKVFDENMVFFLSPSEVCSQIQPADKSLRVGGLVKKDSISYLEDGAVKFVLTDNSKELIVIYNGVTPSLFKEGSGAVAFGKMDSKGDIFYASELLAKHDENYKPRK